MPTPPARAEAGEGRRAAGRGGGAEGGVDPSIAAAAVGFARRLGLPAPPWIVGHRGAAGEAPENTLESFARAVEQGASMIELDVQLTADGHAVVVHDWTLRRLAGSRLRVETATLDRLRSRNVGRYLRPDGPPAILPTLAEVLAALPPALPLNLELKRTLASRAALVEATLARVGGRGGVLVSGFDWEMLRLCRERSAGLALAPLTEEDDVEALLAVADELGAVSLHCHHRIADRDLVRRAAAAGRPVLAYTVNRAELARRLLGRGVAGVFTDFPGQLRRELAAS